jgi:hypothetical protein
MHACLETGKLAVMYACVWRQDSERHACVSGDRIVSSHACVSGDRKVSGHAYMCLETGK